MECRGVYGSSKTAMSPEATSRKEKALHEAFEISIVLKGIGAVAETVLGLLLLYSAGVVDLVRALIENELLDDPDGFLAIHFSSLLAPSPEAQRFGGLYLLSHGVVKLVLVVGLWRGILWSYPASLVVFALFIVYQVDRWFQTHSPWLLFLTVVDLAIMWLIWHEYRERLAHAQPMVQ